MGMGAPGRRGSSGSGGQQHQHNGGFGYWVGGSNNVSRAAEMIEGPGMRILEPNARNGNTTFIVQENEMELGVAVIDGQLGVQQIGFKTGGIDYAEFTEISFRLFTAQPTTMRGGIYVRPDFTNTVEAELISKDQGYEDWKGSIWSKTFALERLYRQPVGLWWVPSIVSPIPLKFEVSVNGRPRWHSQAAGAQEV